MGMPSMCFPSILLCGCCLASLFESPNWGSFQPIFVHKALPLPGKLPPAPPRSGAPSQGSTPLSAEEPALRVKVFVFLGLVPVSPWQNREAKRKELLLGSSQFSHIPIRQDPLEGEDLH